MSRVGKKPVLVPSGVTVELKESSFKAKGAKGELSMQFMSDVHVNIEDVDQKKFVVLTPKSKSNSGISRWGMQRALVANIIHGVSVGFEKILEIQGVGYRAQVKGDILNLQLGYSHDIQFPIPIGVSIEALPQNQLKVSGVDKQLVGQVAAKIRSYRKPEPYKGKGVRYAGELIYLKEGKKK